MKLKLWAIRHRKLNTKEHWIAAAFFVSIAIRNFRIQRGACLLKSKLNLRRPRVYLPLFHAPIVYKTRITT